ncbi:helix-turn-helix transcriptional regulator [Mucilaginibacter sp. 14171R-50]|uniref:AraC family transcriptional regulator n=1 Tax=Mucilaginibacter sp. 14171R-50 TaxID=2703789 RepID=UPI00138DC317|nr:AraC family transcriptional regulator [Mucilaginibacter sp. 14171R-50]QHS55690.1 helix-turn-helix transcriptional regulator [Mucilaginibacter sp. 14171R-50]
MKVLPFTIPVPHDKTIIVQRETLPSFYPHLHRHAEVQITRVREGHGTLLAGNSMHPFGPGEIYVLGVNLPHVFKSSTEYFEEDSNLTIDALTIFFDPKGKMSALFDLPEMKAVQLFFEQWQCGFKIPAAGYVFFSSLIDKVEKSAGASQMAAFIEMLHMMSKVDGLQPLSTVNYAQPLTDPEGVRIASVYNYIMHNFSKPLTLDEVAQQAHLTPNAFCRYFKKHTRVTFTAFVNKVRVNQACKLLVSSNYNSIADVAYNCGFTSVTNFNYVFKNVTGRAPRDYVNEYERELKVKPR